MSASDAAADRADAAARESDRASVASASELTTEQVDRYSRHLLVREIGLAGQQAICRASVLIVGVGGLGSPLALYLAGSGVGRLGLVDYDSVELSNLHRQVLHTTRSAGVPKVSSGASAIGALNPLVTVEQHHVALSAANAMAIVREYDLVCDASDNVATRYLLNDACVLAGKPLVSGSALGLEGQLTVYAYRGGPCFRCLHPRPPPPATVGNCSDAGVLGVVPGVIGTMQALEALKILGGFGEPLSARLLLFDALAPAYRIVKLRARSRECAVCGDTPTVRALVDYEQFCGAPANDKDAPAVLRLPESMAISPTRYAQVRTACAPHVLLDVRDRVQFSIAALPGALSIPLGELAVRVDEVKAAASPSVPVYVVCRRGRKSQDAIELLLSAGLVAPLFNVNGGMRAWRTDVDPSFPVI